MLACKLFEAMLHQAMSSNQVVPLCVLQILTLLASKSLASDDYRDHHQRYPSMEDQMESIELVSSNLSCFECLTINDMRCRYLNETIGRGKRDDLLSTDTVSSEDFSGYEEVGLSDMSQFNHPDDANDTRHAGHDFLKTFETQCKPDEHFCVVLRLGVSSKTVEDRYNFFALKRSCSAHCTEGCFIIGKGERTKLSFCSTCCKDNLCNIGNGALATGEIARSIVFCILVVLTCFVAM